MKKTLLIFRLSLSNSVIVSLKVLIHKFLVKNLQAFELYSILITLESQKFGQTFHTNEWIY